MKPEELRKMKCAKCNGTDPDCDGSEPLILNSRCHMGDGVTASYIKKTHQLVLRCASCGKHVVTIEFSPLPN